MTTTPRCAACRPAENDAGLLHFEGEFASAVELVVETFLGRNFGWLPAERPVALAHVAAVIRADSETTDAASARLPYATLLRGEDSRIPTAWRLPPTLRFDPARTGDAEVVERCARMVVAFLRTLHFSCDAEGRHNGSPYDAFLEANRIPRAAVSGQMPADYGRRVGELLAALRTPRFVDDPARTLRQHGQQPFRFGELELEGARIFFRGAIGNAQRSGAGNCAECHVPPEFTDLKFHNTGVAQDDYDRVHGDGAFQRLEIPSLVAREAAPERWLPATFAHPTAHGPLRSPVTHDAPDRADLGLWNVYAHPDLPGPQARIARLLDPAGTRSRDELLARAVGRFKTTTVRDLGQTAPFLHTGHASSIEDVIRLYRRMSERSRDGRMRNPPPEFFSVRLGDEDIAPLAAFLRALNEDYGGPAAASGPAERGPVADLPD